MQHLVFYLLWSFERNRLCPPPLSFDPSVLCVLPGSCVFFPLPSGSHVQIWSHICVVVGVATQKVFFFFLSLSLSRRDVEHRGRSIKKKKVR